MSDYLWILVLSVPVGGSSSCVTHGSGWTFWRSWSSELFSVYAASWERPESGAGGGDMVKYVDCLLYEPNPHPPSSESIPHIEILLLWRRSSFWSLAQRTPEAPWIYSIWYFLGCLISIHCLFPCTMNILQGHKRNNVVWKKHWATWWRWGRWRAAEEGPRIISQYFS